jgi:hypothetical protein
MKKLFIFYFLLYISIYSIVCEELNNREKDMNYSIQIKPLDYLALIGVNIANKALNPDSDTLHLLFGVEFQFVLNNYFNVSIEPSFQYGKFDEEITYQYDITLGGLLRPFGTGLKGMYIGLYPSVGIDNMRYPNINDTLFLFGIKGEIGYQWIFKNGFTIALGGGIGDHFIIPFTGNKNKYEEIGTIMGAMKLPFELVLNFSIGYSF